MLQISKKLEYALIAIRHMARRGTGSLVTAKEIAEHYRIPYELLAKILQRLAREGIIVSQQGVNGGYAILLNPSQIRLSDVFHAIEGKPQVSIIQCESETPENCCIHTTCTIKDPLVKIQTDINRLFHTITVSEIV